MQRADIGLYRHRRQLEIYCGLISGYTAKSAGFAGKKRLDKMNAISGYYGVFSWLLKVVETEIYRQWGGSILSS